MSKFYKTKNATRGDFEAIDQLLREAFGGPDEADLVMRLRTLPSKSIELVAISGVGIIGHIFLSELVSPNNWGALAPLAVAGNSRTKGVGAALIYSAITHAENISWSALAVLGDPKYYSRFGFSTELSKGYKSPYPIEFTGLLPLSGNATAREGNLVYPSVFEGV